MRTLKIDDTRLAFIVGMTVAAKTKVELAKFYTDFNISLIDQAMADSFKDSIISEIKDNVVKSSTRKKRSDSGSKKADALKTPAVELPDDEDEDEDEDDELDEDDEDSDI